MQVLVLREMCSCFVLEKWKKYKYRYVRPSLDQQSFKPRSMISRRDFNSYVILKWSKKCESCLYIGVAWLRIGNLYGKTAMSLRVCHGVQWICDRTTLVVAKSHSASFSWLLLALCVRSVSRSYHDRFRQLLRLSVSIPRPVSTLLKSLLK